MIDSFCIKSVEIYFNLLFSETLTIISIYKFKLIPLTMKKIILTTAMIVSTISLVTSQSTIDDQYNCVNQHYSTLTVCFAANDVTGRFTGGGSTLYFQPDAGIIYTQFSDCVDNYNKDRVSCPVAPLLVIGNGSKKKKTIL